MKESVVVDKDKPDRGLVSAPVLQLNWSKSTTLVFVKCSYTLRQCVARITGQDIVYTLRQNTLLTESAQIT